MSRLTDKQRVLFTAAALRCAALAVPFKHHGRWECPGLHGTKTGLDCVGLGLHCAIAAGLLASAVVDPRAYRRMPIGDSLTKYLEANCGPAIGRSDDALCIGAVAVFSSGPDPSHVAIVVGGVPGAWVMVHADQYFGRVVRQPYAGDWGTPLTGVYLP